MPKTPSSTPFHRICAALIEILEDRKRPPAKRLMVVHRVKVEPKAVKHRRGKTSKAKVSAAKKKQIYQKIYMRKYRARKKKEAKK